jgi:hypothetical protein
VLIGVGAIAVILLRSPTRKSPLAVIPPHYATQAELKQLDAEATRHAAIAQRLMEIETPAPSSTTKLELARDLQLQRDEAALSLIYQAELAPPPDAVALYRKTIDLFPDTHWAALAKQRIAALDATQENL